MTQKARVSASGNGEAPTTAVNKTPSLTVTDPPSEETVVSQSAGTPASQIDSVIASAEQKSVLLVEDNTINMQVSLQ